MKLNLRAISQTLVANGIRGAHPAPAGTLCLSKSVSQSDAETAEMAQHFIDFLNLTQRRAGGSLLHCALRCVDGPSFLPASPLTSPVCPTSAAGWPALPPTAAVRRKAITAGIRPFGTHGISRRSTSAPSFTRGHQ